MADREKIIKGLECHRIDNNHRIKCADCPYYVDDGNHIRCVNDLHDDALALLKEHGNDIHHMGLIIEEYEKELKKQEAKEGHWIVLEYCANEGIYCSECNTKIFDRITKPKYKLSRYCPHCGSRNEQFFRDGEVVFR